MCTYSLRHVSLSFGNNLSQLCHPLMAVAKPSAGVRITVDLMGLDKQVLHPTHPSCCHMLCQPRSMLLFAIPGGGGSVKKVVVCALLEK